jgi:type II secretory pathway component GspD/PulD (secretin)
LHQALAELLTPVGYRARVTDGILSIERADMPVAEDAEEGQRLQAEIPLKYVDVEFAEDLLDGIYPDHDETLTFAMNPVRNSVFLAGNRALVQTAETLLRQADTDAGHILIEVLVVEFNTEALRELGAHIFDAAGGSFSFINLDFSALAAEEITFTHVADAENVTQLTALLNVLIEDSQARIISRPYVATLSNQTANLSITDDRYVTVNSGDGDANLERVNSGVELEVTPVVQWDGLIRMEVDLTESKFVGGADATNLRQTRNNVETTMRVADGETIIIGGLMLNGYQNNDTGLPGIRDTPLLGMVFGHKDQARNNRQVVMYITPHLWTPGMDTPLVNKEPMPPLPPPEVQWREAHEPAIAPGG